MQYRTARKVICNDRFAEKVARSRKGPVEQVVAEAKRVVKENR